MGTISRVLYVDDDPPMAELTQVVLEHAGYRVTVLVDALAAIEAVRTGPERFDIVVADFHMPRCTGPALARQLAVVAPDLPVLLTTGSVDAAHQQEASDAGALDLVEKAPDCRWLLHALAAHAQRACG
jgi:CheY-like chemotaxis protein